MQPRTPKAPAKAAAAQSARCTNSTMRREDSDRLEAVWGDDWLLALLERDRDAFAKTGALIVKAYLAGRCRDEACPVHGAAAQT